MKKLLSPLLLLALVFTQCKKEKEPGFVELLTNNSAKTWVYTKAHADGMLITNDSCLRGSSIIYKADYTGLTKPVCGNSITFKWEYNEATKEFTMIIDVNQYKVTHTIEILTNTDMMLKMKDQDKYTYYYYKAQ